MASNVQSSDRQTVFLGSEGFHLTLDQPSTHYPPPLAAEKPQGKQFKADASAVPSPLLTSVPDRARNVELLVPVTAIDPSMVYGKRYEVELNGDVAVSISRKRLATAENTAEKYDIRKITGPRAEQEIHMLRQIRHRGILHIYEIFDFQGVFYTVSEHMAISCNELISSPVVIEEIYLAAIFYQVLDGLSFLASQGLVHGAVTCSNILISERGDVKIANQEFCYSPSQSQNLIDKDKEDAGLVMITLMDRVKPEGRHFRLRDPNRWSPDAVEFLSLMISAPYEQLQIHPFLKGAPLKDELSWIAGFVRISATVYYRYKGVYSEFSSPRS